LDDYLFSHDKDCAGCGVCLNQRRKLLSFKYPKSVKSRYNELYAPHRPSHQNRQTMSFDQNNNLGRKLPQFNYDRLRQDIRKSHPESEMIK
jgi:hypothetical protein